MPVFRGTGYLNRNRRSDFNTSTVTTDTIRLINTKKDIHTHTHTQILLQVQVSSHFIKTLNFFSRIACWDVLLLY